MATTTLIFGTVTYAILMSHNGFIKHYKRMTVKAVPVNEITFDDKQHAICLIYFI